MARRLRFAKWPSIVPHEKLSRSRRVCQPAMAIVSRGESVAIGSARRTSFPIGGAGGPAGESGVTGGVGGLVRDETGSLFFYQWLGWPGGWRTPRHLGIFLRDLRHVGQGQGWWVEEGGEDPDPSDKGPHQSGLRLSPPGLRKDFPIWSDEP